MSIQTVFYINKAEHILAHSRLMQVYSYETRKQKNKIERNHQFGHPNRFINRIELNVSINRTLRPNRIVDRREARLLGHFRRCCNGINFASFGFSTEHLAQHGVRRRRMWRVACCTLGCSAALLSLYYKLSLAGCAGTCVRRVSQGSQVMHLNATLR